LDINILEDRENPLLRRREVAFEISFTGATPSRKEVKEALTSRLGVDANLVVIGKLAQPFGISSLKGRANIYKDEAARSVEHGHLLRRDAGERGGKKEKKAPAKAEGIGEKK